MSLIRKVSLEYRLEREKKRAEKSRAASAIQMQRFQEALRMGVIKVPTFKAPQSARLAPAREHWLKRIMAKRGITMAEAADRLEYRGHRVGAEGPHEVQTRERKPERNKYAGYFSPGTWRTV